MSGYPLVLDGHAVEALIVGGGQVAERKTKGLLAAGATVRVVAIKIASGIRARGVGESRLSLVERPFADHDIGGAQVVIAATSSRVVNSRVATLARRLNRLVIVTDRPQDGNCVTPAVHRSGELMIAVSAGVPTVAARIRDTLERRFDARYADALQALADIRRRMLSEGDSQAWRETINTLAGEDFCVAVESGSFASRLAAWRDRVGQTSEAS